jgi:hypothetical protein
MSAFMVSSDHIDALIHLALFGPVDSTNWYAPMFSNPSRKLDVFSACILGYELERENVLSLRARYPKQTHLMEPYVFPDNLFTVPPRLSAVAALKLLQCYEYQSCEHEEWHDSATRRFCDHLKDSLIRQLQGYEAAPWDI